MNNKTHYIGLDVDKESIAIAYAQEGSRQEATYYGTCGGSNLAAERALISLAKKIGVKLQDLKVCYEAAPSPNKAEICTSSTAATPATNFGGKASWNGVPRPS